jgi:transcriptional regulator with XRE-family HTH domain
VQKSIFTPEQEALTRLLRSMREEAGLRQQDVADRLAKPQSFVSKYESGERRLDLIELRDVAAALNVALLELVAQFEESLSDGR